MPPKAPPGKAGGKGGPPAAMLAKIKAQMEAQKKAEEDWKRQQEEEERKRKEEERIAEEERKREEEERRVAREAEKVEEASRKVDKKRDTQMEALERMRAAGMIVPDFPVHKPGEKKPAPAPKQAIPKPAPTKPKPVEVVAPLVKETAPAPAPMPEDDLADDWEALADAPPPPSAAEIAAEARAKVEAEKQAAEDARRAEEEQRKKEDEALVGTLRSPICCVMGHVDAGKTSLLDRIRKTNVQGGEAGGITQQIGATFFPRDNLVVATQQLTEKYNFQMKVPGLLVIDTPGHESFANLRSRGSSLCDIAVLVVDITAGLEQQAKESIKMLREKRCPFIVALNKVDRMYEWQPTENLHIEAALAKQKAHVLSEFDTRVTNVKTEFMEQGLNAELYYKNKDVKNVVSIVPCSAKTGEGVCDLLMVMIQLVQRFLENKVSFKEDLACTVLEVKPVQGIGTTIDVVLVNGTLHAGDRIMVCGLAGPIQTQIRALLTPQPMKELRVRGEYVHHTTVRAAMGVKIAANDLENAVPGTPLVVLRDGDDIAAKKEEVMKDFNSLLSSVQKNGVGVAIQSSTLGSLEALLAFLEQMKIPVAHIALGPIHKKHLQTVIGMKDRSPKFAIMLAFDVPIAPEAQEVADKNGVKIFSAKVIYHLFDAFTQYSKDWDKALQDKNREIAVFPVVLRIIDKIRAKDPIILHCEVVRGQLHPGTPLIVQTEAPAPGSPVPQKVHIGRVTGMEKDHKEILLLKKGQDAAVKLNAPDSITFGRQFTEASVLVSAVSRVSIDALKESFRGDMDDDDWRLIIQLKKEQCIQ